MLKAEGLGYKKLFENLHFDAVAGEKIVLLGQNGCGKSTLLALLNGLIFPDTGRVIFNGREVNRKSLKLPDFARSFRSETGLVFQDPGAMLFHASVYDELAFGPRQRGVPNVDTVVRDCAWEFGLTHLLQTPPYELSGGERQKTALACVMINRPRLLLLDEPTANLDPAATGWLIDKLRELDATVITSVHHLSMAKELGERALVLGENGLLFDGPIREFTGNIDLLVRAGLAHKHKHQEHGKWHVHDWS
jgi:cobalt/nickel transport system ATP-binding protein